MKNSLNLYFDENSLRHSKIRFSELTEMSYERKHPLLLRNNSYFTKLIVLDSHEKGFHDGVDITLNFIRATYLIIKGRQTVKSILRKCVTCKLVYGKTVTPPKEPSLPSFSYQVSRYQVLRIHSKQSELIMMDQFFTNLQLVEMLK